MKRLHAHTCLLCLAFVIGCFVALMLVWAGQPVGASRLDSAPQVGMAAPLPLHAAMPNAETTPPPPITCNVSITTSDYLIASQNIAVPSNVGNLTKLGLVGNPAVLGPQTTLVNYFQLYPATIGTEYTLDALPTNGNNYDLGIYVYVSPGPGTYTDVYTQLDFTNEAAEATFVATDRGPYIFAVFQKSIGCSGGTYYLQFGTTPATPTPTSTPTATGSPTPTPTATPSWTLPDQYDSSTYAPNYNDALANAVALGASTTTGLTLYNAVLYPSDPGNDQDWYAIYGLVGYQYSVSAGPDTGYTYPYLFLEIYAPDKTTLVGRVDGSNNPTINWTASTSGTYFIHIKRSVGSPTSGTYHVTWATNSPTVTPTATPTVPPPVSAFTASPRSGYPPLIVKFTDQSSGLITGRLWRFGDGTMSTLRDPTYAYPANGAYTVALTVSGPGGSDTLAQTNYIRAYLPQPIFSEPVCGTTNNTLPIISGLAPYGFTIKLYDDGTQLSTVAATFSDTFAFASSFVSGRHVLTATAANVAGRVLPHPHLCLPSAHTDLRSGRSHLFLCCALGHGHRSSTRFIWLRQSRRLAYLAAPRIHHDRRCARQLHEFGHRHDHFGPSDEDGG